MRIFFIEFIWQIDQIIKKDHLKNDIVVSTDPECSYILKSKNIDFFESSDFCNHEELWQKYKEITDHTFKITKALDQALFSSDKRFEKLNWKFFDNYHYVIKICYDQLYYYSELISAILKKYNPSEIVIANSKNISFKESLTLNPNSSVLKFILISHSNPKYKISYMNLEDKKYSNSFFNFTFGQPRYLLTINNLKKKVNGKLHEWKFIFNYFFFNAKYFSIGCQEVERLKRLYPKKTKKILSYFHENLNRYSIKNDVNFLKNFNENLFEKTDYNNLTIHKSFNFRIVLDKLIERSILFLDFYINNYYKAKKILTTKKIECVIFQSMSPFFSPNIIFRKACNDLKIPYTTWAHGGYCTNSLAGYDVTDFRLCKNHLSYGEFMNDLVNDKNCSLNKIYKTHTNKIFPLGSARLDYDNIKIQKKKNLNNKKPTVLFMTGSITPKNNFYFGTNRKYTENSIWKIHYDTLLLLKKYQNKYNIIFKDYPNGFPRFWKKVLKDIGADKISYISGERTVSNLLKISDLNIMPWISTTFFEALYFNADIFVLDEDIYEKPFTEKINKEIFWFKNETKFKSDLENYLNEGKFYRTTKNKSRKYFLNFEKPKSKIEILTNALIEIKNEEKNYITT